MKDEKVLITDDYITLESNIRSVVMSKTSKSLTDIHCHIVCQNRGDILDIGYGMGFSANKIYELADSYTCIEINPQIYERAIKWAKGKLNVNIILGDWIDVIPSLDKKFDGIFFDTHNDPNSHLAEEYAKQVSKEGTIFSHWNYFQIRRPEEMNRYRVPSSSNLSSDTTLSPHSIYWTYFHDKRFIKGSSKIKFNATNKVI